MHGYHHHHHHHGHYTNSHNLLGQVFNQSHYHNPYPSFIQQPSYSNFAPQQLYSYGSFVLNFVLCFVFVYYNKIIEYLIK